MRGRHWNWLPILTVAALAACGGGQTGEDAQMDETPATDPAATPADTLEVGQQATDLPEGVTQEQVSQGRQLFSGQGGCHACHNPQATGTQLAPDLTDDEWLNISGRDLDEIVQLIRTGVPQPEEHPAPMPPMGGASLTDEQIQALAAYVVSLGQG